MQKKYRKLLFNNKFIKEKLSNSDLEKILLAKIILVSVHQLLIKCQNME